MPNQRGNIVLVLLLVLAILAGAAALLFKDTIVNFISPAAPVTSTQGLLKTQSSYQNPFDNQSSASGSTAQYSNPFDSYQNPFDNVK